MGIIPFNVILIVITTQLKLFYYHNTLTLPMLKSDNIDVLTKQLEELRLERVNVIEYLEELNKREIKTIKRLEEANAKAEASVKRVCLFVLGDIVCITNRLRNEYGTVGTVRKIRNRPVTIRKSGSDVDYNRARINLDLVASASARPRKKNTRKQP